MRDSHAARFGYGAELAEHLCHLPDKAHLDIGARQRRADEEVASLQRAVDITEMVGQFAVDPRMQRRAGFLQPRHVEVQHQGQHRGAFRIMQPLVVGLKLGAAGRRHHGALAVAADDVIDDRCRFAILMSPSVMIGDLPSGCTAFSSGGASRVSGLR